MDASFETIKEIRPAYTHPGGGLEPELMERVEIAIVANGWQVIVQKGAHKPGDEVFYIRPDARITNRAAWATEETRRYLGAGGRVKTIMIWGNVSDGMILPASALPADVKEHTDDLCEYLGIDHWEPPIPQDMSILICCLPDGIDKSDEENFQNLSDEDLHLGEEVLVTRKMDGTSCTVYYNPKTDYLAVCSRTMQLKLDCVNNFTAATAPLLPIVKELAHHYGETVAIRGEICGAGIQSNKVNKDSKGPATFFMYGTRFPDREDRDEKFGRWGKRYTLPEGERESDGTGIRSYHHSGYPWGSHSHQGDAGALCKRPGFRRRGCGVQRQDVLLQGQVFRILLEGEMRWPQPKIYRIRLHDGSILCTPNKDMRKFDQEMHEIMTRFCKNHPQGLGRRTSMKQKSRSSKKSFVT